MTKCPKCEKHITSARLADVAIGKWKGVSYSCPFCFLVLSVAIDPIAIKSDTVSEINDELKKVKAALAKNEQMLGRIIRHLDA